LVATPLPVEPALKLPQSALPQVTDQATPALEESLVTVAVNPMVELTAMDAGGETNATLIGGGGGGGGVELELHPTRAATRVKATRESISCRNFIARLH